MQADGFQDHEANQVPPQVPEVPEVIRLVEAKRGRFMVFDNDRYLGKSLIELGKPHFQVVTQ